MLLSTSPKNILQRKTNPSSSFHKFGKSFHIVTLDWVHCKKELAVFPSPAGMSLTKLFLGGPFYSVVGGRVKVVKKA
jgi:hypothetical protein